jgi:hypothetical protein
MTIEELRHDSELDIPKDASPRETLTWFLVNRNFQAKEDEHPGSSPIPMEFKQNMVDALLNDPTFDPEQYLLTTQELKRKLLIGDTAGVEEVVHQAAVEAVVETDFRVPATEEFRMHEVGKLAASHALSIMQGRERFTPSITPGATS